MDMNNLVDVIFAHDNSHQRKENIKDEDDFAHFMEAALKDIFGEDVEFKKVEEVDDDENDIHINIKEESPADKLYKRKERSKELQEFINIVTEDEMEMVKHIVRKIAQQHKKETSLDGIYTAVAAHLMDESRKLLYNKEKARYEAQKAAKVKSEVMSKFNDFTQGLSAEEQDALDELLAEI